MGERTISRRNFLAGITATGALAAAFLEMNLRTLYRKLDKYQIDLSLYRT